MCQSIESIIAVLLIGEEQSCFEVSNRGVELLKDTFYSGSCSVTSYKRVCSLLGRKELPRYYELWEKLYKNSCPIRYGTFDDFIERFIMQVE